MISFATFDLAGLEAFDEVWLVDAEYSAQSGCRPVPICVVARELRSGRELRLWQDELAAMAAPPFRTDDRALFVSYAAPAEFSVFHALGWPAPARILDLFVEFRAMTNGLKTPSGAGLLGALVYHGLPAMEGAEKTAMRDLAIRGGPFTDEERQALLDYCAEDVQALERLLPRMLPRIDLPRALLRGRYGWAAASMEHRGIPIDVPMFEHLRALAGYPRGARGGGGRTVRSFRRHHVQAGKIHRLADWEKNSMAAARKRPTRFQGQDVPRHGEGLPGRG